MRLTEEQRWGAVIRAESGESHHSIAHSLKVSQPAISKLVMKHEQTETVHDLPRAGRKHISDPHTIRALVQHNTAASSQKLANILAQKRDMEISARTVRRERHNLGFRQVYPRSVPRLTAAHKAARVAYCKRHRHDSFQDSVFEDEASICLNRTTRKVWVLPGDERPIKFSEDPHIKIMVAGAISWEGVLPLVLIKNTMDAEVYQQFLEEDLLPAAEEQYGSDFILLHDRATPHTAKTTTAYLNSKESRHELLPPKSPDLNSIEMMWSPLKSFVESAMPNNRQQLWDSVQQYWSTVSVEQAQNTISHMKTRIPSIIASHGEFSSK
jgi:transposase